MRLMPSSAAWLAPIAVGTLLRLTGLTGQSLWVDEILTLKAASLGEPFRWHDVLINPQGPLPQVWLRMWCAVAGTSDTALRLWAVFGGVLGLVVAAAALKRWAGAAGLWGLWLLALSPFHIWYSQEVRNYVYLMAFSWLTLWALDGLRRRMGAGSWAALTGALAGAVLCNLSALFLVPALTAGAWLKSRRLGAAVGGAGLAAVLIASPWIVTEFTQHMDFNRVAGDVSEIRGGRTFPPGMIPFTAVVFLGGFGSAPPLRELHTGVAAEQWLEYVPALVLMAAAGAWLFFSSLRHRPGWQAALMWLWILVPVLLSVGVALLGLKAYNPRYISVVYPAWILLLTFGYKAGVQARPGWARGSVAVLMAVMLLGLARQQLDAGYHKEDFRGAARLAEERNPDLVLLEGVSGPFQRYYQGEAPVGVFYRNYVLHPEGRAALDSLVLDRERLLWIGSRLWYVDPDSLVLGWLRDVYGPEVWSGSEEGVVLREFERAEP